MPRPKLPEGLYVSVSQMKCWLRCPRQFELKYIRGVPPAFVPVNLAFGSAIHAALAAYYQEIRISGNPLRRDLVLEVFRDAWAKAEEGDIPLQVDEDGDEPVNMVDKGVSMLHAFHDHSSKVPPFEAEAVEHGFTVNLHDPDTGEVLDEQLVGTMDLVILEDGRRVVVEHKTAARKYGEDLLRFDLQVSGYKLAAREAGLGEVGLRFQVITKTKVPAVQVTGLTRDHQDEEDFVRTTSAGHAEVPWTPTSSGRHTTRPSRAPRRRM
jgi:putative RecB family exonuclease